MKTKTSLFKLTLFTLILVCIGFSEMYSQYGYGDATPPEYTNGVSENPNSVFKICGGGVIEDGLCKEAHFLAYLDEDCTSGYIKINVYAVNLDILSNADSDGNYAWPYPEEELYVGLRESQIEGAETQVVGPIIKFRELGPLENGIIMYRSTFKVTTPTLENLECADEENTEVEERFQLYISALKRVSSGLYNNFPIEDYSSYYNVFSCSAFPENFVSCNNDYGSGVSHGRSFEACIDCNECDKLESSAHAIEDRSIDSQENIVAFPNPFTSEIDIEFYSAFNETATINLYDIKSRLIKTLKVEIEEGNNQLRVETETLNNGIYYLNIQSDNHRKVFKMVKH